MVISHIDSMRDVVDGLIEIKKVNGFSQLSFSENFYTYHLEKDILGGHYPIYFRKGEDGGGHLHIKWYENFEFPKVNSLMEMCSNFAGFIGYWLKHKYNIPELHLVDIHEPLRDSMQKTNKKWM